MVGRIENGACLLMSFNEHSLLFAKEDDKVGYPSLRKQTVDDGG